MELSPGSVIGPYVVRRKIAEGGMAEIYLASRKGAEGFERDVVIKRVREFLAQDPQFVEMFITEARLAARLVHPNVVQVFDFDRAGDAYYIAMEFVHGKSLAEVRHRARERMRPLTPILAVHIAHEVAKGLGHAHRLRASLAPNGVVHRDVTPHNVLVSWGGDVKLTDFGIAKAGSRGTGAGVLKGKFAYMSPEQSRGDDVDVRTDVFALGIVLWELFTGARLFEGSSDLQVLKAVQQAEIAPPARLNAEVPADASDLVMTALERDPARRFADGHALAGALQEILFAHARAAVDVDLAGYVASLFGEAPVRASAGFPMMHAGNTAVLGGAVARPDVDPEAGTALRAEPAPVPTPGPGASTSSTVRGRRVGARSEAAEAGGASVGRGPPRRAMAIGAAALAVVAGSWVALRRSASSPPESTPVAATSPARDEVAAASPPPPTPSGPSGAGAPIAPPAPAAVAAPETTTAPQPLPPPAASEPATPADPEPAPATSVRPRHEIAGAPAPSGSASLQVIVAPWATVIVDGVRLGDGPGFFAIPAGRHRVRLSNPEAGIDRTFRVEAAAGGSVVVNATR